MATYYPDSSRNRLRWYLCLWVCLASLWGLFEISSRTIAAAWNACVIGSRSAEMCEQLKQYPGLQGQPDIASLPPAVLATLLLHALIAFFLILILYVILLWLSLAPERRPYQLWAALCIQGLLACTMGLFLPALSLAVPVSLVLALILEVCALFKAVRTVLAFSGALLVCFLLATLLAWWQGYAFSASAVSILVALALLSAGFLFVGGFFVLYTRLVQMHTTIETAYNKLEAANARIEALTLVMERQRMARELHDTLAQGLAGVILQLGVAQARVKEQHDESLRTLLEQTLASARDTLASARSAIGDLRTHSPSSTNIIEEAREEVRRFTLLSGISCTAELDPLSQTSPAHSEQITGVIREGLANVARHAHAQHAWVRVSRAGERLCLEIGDDGIGFDPDLAQPGHYGLVGLQERAQLAGGQMAILSTPGQGSRVQLFWRADPAQETRGEE